MEYKFGTKNNWRRWAWNAIRERLVVPPRQAVVAYLGAATDLDREIARSKGFDDRNLIFIDRDAEVVSAARKRGRLAIQGDFTQAIREWPKSLPLHAVFGDFCCGLERRFVYSLAYGMTVWPQCRRSVFAFNFLRGRDPSSNTIRQVLAEDPYAHKHRGIHAALQFSFGVCVASSGTQGVSGYGISIRPGFTEIVKQAAASGESNHVIETMMSAFNEYKSTSGQVFDSAIWRHPLAPAQDVPQLSKQDAFFWKHGAGPLRRQLAAIAAHRTMRLAA
jgi:hypothetical protein